MNPPAERRPLKLLATNQVVSNLFGDLTDAFVDYCDEVCLLAGYLAAGKGRDRFEWIRACPLQKAPAWKRIWTWCVFTVQAVLAMVRHRNHFLFLVTNPPLVPWVAPLVKRLLGIRYAVLVYDVYPDVMARMNMIRPGGWIDRFLRRASARSLLEAEVVFTIGNCMKETFLAHLPPGREVPVVVIPNWADTEYVKPIPRGDNPFAREQGLEKKFVVMYSGTFGATHDIESIVDAAEMCQDLAGVRFVLIGGGTREEEVRQYVQRKALPNLVLLPWEPPERVPFSVTSADCLIVSLDEAYAGISVPGKTYTCLAAGAAILAVSPPGTEIVDLVREHECGIWVRPRSADDLAAAVRTLYGDPERLKRLQKNARAAAEQHYTIRICTRHYVEALMPVIRRAAEAQVPRVQGRPPALP